MRTADFFAAELLLEHGAWSMEHGAWSMACDVSMVHGLCLYLCGCPDARTCPVSRHIQWDMSRYVQICLDRLLKPLETACLTPF